MVVFDPATGQDRLAQDVVDARARPGRRSSTRSTRAASPAAELETFTHGTTVGTNALIERTGCKVAFVTTKGFEDTPFIQRINRKVLYDLRWRKPEPLVASRRLCLGLDERLDADGDEVTARRRGRGARALPHDPRERRRGGRALRCSSRTSAPTTRSAVKEILAEELPGVPVSVSHEVAPIWREYERSSTTIADAYLRPLFGRYVDEPRRRAPRRRA